MIEVKNVDSEDSEDSFQASPRGQLHESNIDLNFSVLTGRNTINDKNTTFSPCFAREMENKLVQSQNGLSDAHKKGKPIQGAQKSDSRKAKKYKPSATTTMMDMRIQKYDQIKGKHKRNKTKGSLKFMYMENSREKTLTEEEIKENQRQVRISQFNLQNQNQSKQTIENINGCIKTENEYSKEFMMRDLEI